MHTVPVTRAAIYVRISEDREGLGLGVERQEEDCRALADRLGYDVTELYRDNDISASTKSRRNRPNYRRLLDDSHAGLHQVVIAYTSSRLTRRPRENEDLIDLAQERGIRFEYVRSPSFDLNTAAGRRVARILAATDAGTAEDISELAARKKAQAAAAGMWLGGPRPFGYEGDGVTVRESEAAELRTAADAILSGFSLRGYTKTLNERSVLTSTGRPFTPNELRKVLIRPRNAGLVERHGEIIGKAQWPAILDEDRWRALVAVVTDPARKTQWNSARRWMLSGIARCYCGSPVLCTLRSSNRQGTPAYTCKAAKHVSRVAADMDRFIGSLVVERLSRPDAVELLATTGDTSVTKMHIEAAGLQDRLNVLATLFADGSVTGDQLRSGTAQLRDRLARVEASIAQASRGSVLAGLAGAPNLNQVWGGLDLDRRRAVISELVEITIHRTKKGRPKGWRPGAPYFNPETIQIDWKS